MSAFQSHASSTHLLLDCHCLQVSWLWQIGSWSFPGILSRQKGTLVFTQTWNKSSGRKSPSGASKVCPEAAHFVFIGSSPKARVSSLGSLPAHPLLHPLPPWSPEKAISTPFQLHTLLQSGLRVPESEAICFCCIRWNTVASPSQWQVTSWGYTCLWMILSHSECTEAPLRKEIILI